ncbi:MAG TPA: EamA family transporter RarD [Anaerolineaceae bacterium]|nr:EamA family transporter RarD [Anaerolineaceae bacterium]HOH20522.1 EamA family transporter RarD [Anaerolineaceae bacterium]HQP61923.1 EamA family transporter RarD [Anaerolineaceae bacterium]
MKNKGVLFALAAYILWGFFPLYFKAIQQVSALQILAHRIAWGFVFTLAVVLVLRQWKEFRASVFNRRTFLIYAGASVVLGINWFTYVWAVITNHVVESSLGYFINPIVSVLLGVIFLRERLRTFQWVAIAMVTAGVVYLTITFGQLPWISLVLAVTFGFYGLLKKIAPLGALHGITLETAVLTIPSLAYLFIVNANGTGTFGHSTPLLDFLLVLSGPVTAIPLLLFATGARRIPLTTIGLLQYIAPTLQFLLGVLVFHEPFDQTRLIGFMIIWLALVLFSVENLLARRRTPSTAPIPAEISE